MALRPITLSNQWPSTKLKPLPFHQHVSNNQPFNAFQLPSRLLIIPCAKTHPRSDNRFTTLLEPIFISSPRTTSAVLDENPWALQVFYRNRRRNTKHGNVFCFGSVWEPFTHFTTFSIHRNHHANWKTFSTGRAKTGKMDAPMNNELSIIKNWNSVG